MKYGLILIGVLLFVSACSQSEQNTVVIDSFESCAAAGFAVMESYPRQCNDGTTTFVEVITEPIQKPCTREYRPVCGEVQIPCVTTPCDPITTTFGNMCEATNAGATILYEGECRDNMSRDEQLEGACLSFDGRWNSFYQECEGMPAEMCEDLGGRFDTCASACRHNPNAEMCTMQCVQICTFY
jgi:hypothetical protein